jgi:hypothetical protein
MSAPLPLTDAAARLRGKPGRPPLSDEVKAERAEQRRETRAAQLAAIAPRLLDLECSARYTGLSGWTLRDLEAAGILRRVRIPTANGGELRKLLCARDDLDRLIESWKDPA